MNTIEEGNIKALSQVEGQKLTIRDSLSLKQITKERKNKEGVDMFLINEDLPRDLATNPNYHKSPLNSNHATGLIIHELGHSLSNSKKSFYDDFAVFIEKKTGNSDYINTVAYKDLSLNSLFGTPEFFADAFTDYIINKENASEAGKLIPKFLKEQGII